MERVEGRGVGRKIDMMTFVKETLKNRLAIQIPEEGKGDDAMSRIVRTNVWYTGTDQYVSGNSGVR